MKLFAQHGSQEGNKIQEGLTRKLLDGVIYSPRDVSLSNLDAKLRSSAAEFPEVVRLMDPQYYAVFQDGEKGARLGRLLDDYATYFKSRRRSELERERNIQVDLDAALTFQKERRVSGFIAPNIVIGNSLNSVDAVIAKNFIRQTGERYALLNDDRPVYATLAISVEALSNTVELADFLNDITLLDAPPVGFYVLVSTHNAEARSDIYNRNIIGAWMYINHVLHINGFEVINGYSDILTPFLGAAGGSAGALGWFTTLRQFSLNRYERIESRGGGPSVLKYLSATLLNRIRFYELDRLRDNYPTVLNGLESDLLYSNRDSGSEPQRNMEVVQSWEAVKALNKRLIGGDAEESLQKCIRAVGEAQTLYDIIQSEPPPLDTKSNDDHIEPLLNGVKLFSQLAELE